VGPKVKIVKVREEPVSLKKKKEGVRKERFNYLWEAGTEKKEGNGSANLKLYKIRNGPKTSTHHNERRQGHPQSRFTTGGQPPF